MSDAAEKLVCELRSLGGPDAERMADGTRLTALAILARRAAAYIEHQAAELARKTTVAEAQWEIVESFKKENAELRAALEWIDGQACWETDTDDARTVEMIACFTERMLDGETVAQFEAEPTFSLRVTRERAKARALAAQEASHAE